MDMPLDLLDIKRGRCFVAGKTFSESVGKPAFELRQSRDPREKHWLLKHLRGNDGCSYGLRRFAEK